MPQRLRTRLPNAVVLRFFLYDRGLSPRLDAWQLKLIAEYRGQLFERDINFHQVAATRVATRRPLPVLGIASLGNWLALFPVPLPHTPCPVVAETEMRHIERRHRNTYEIAALPADHLAVRDVLAQILADPAADNLSKAALIALNFHDHRL